MESTKYPKEVPQRFVFALFFDKIAHFLPFVSSRKRRKYQKIVDFLYY